MPIIPRWTFPVAVTCGLLASCSSAQEDNPDGSSGITTNPATGTDGAASHGTTEASTTGGDEAETDGASAGSSSDPSTSTGTSMGDPTTSGGPKFDLGATPDAPSDETAGPCDTEGCMCTIPDHVPCDGATTDVFQAMGLNCPGELQVTGSTSGPATARQVRAKFGNTNTFTAREGAVYAVLGSGLVADLDKQTPNTDAFLSHSSPTHCNDNLGAYDPGNTLPAPLKVNNVGAQDCAQDPALVGTGDCSNTIQGQFSQGNSANDYVEMRFTADVPSDVVSFSYDFAFFSTEYPFYFGSAFNDMYVGWLESEKWTGNVSFDAMGNPISLNAGFLDFKDNNGNLAEFQGTCMRYHAGTNWLTTTAGVTPGENITVVFAIFDLSDSILDSYVFLDNFQWGCVPSGKPETKPPG